MSPPSGFEFQRIGFYKIMSSLRDFNGKKLLYNPEGMTLF